MRYVMPGLLVAALVIAFSLDSTPTQARGGRGGGFGGGGGARMGGAGFGGGMPGGAFGGGGAYRGTPSMSRVTPNMGARTQFSQGMARPQFSGGGISPQTLQANSRPQFSPGAPLRELLQADSAAHRHASAQQQEELDWERLVIPVSVRLNRS